MYVSWNDFNVGGGASESRFSTDNGATWHAPSNGQLNTFIRNVQITGDAVTGDVYIAGMDEGGGGFPHNDTNNIYQVHRRRQYLGQHLHRHHLSRAGRVLCQATSPACFPTNGWLTGGTRAGVNLPPTTASFTWSMPSTAPAPTPATSITSAPPTAG